MPANRKTMRQLNDARMSERREEIKVAIAEGRLIVRQMTPRERREADARRPALAEARTPSAASRGR